MARERKKTTNGTFSPEEFVAAYERASCVDEVAEKLGVTPVMVEQRARVYRRMGVPLKKMSRKRGVDVAALTHLVESIRKQQNDADRYTDDGK